MSPVLAPKEKAKRPELIDLHYRGPEDLIGEVRAAADDTGISLNEAMTQLLRAGLAAYQKEQQRKKNR